MKIIEKDTGIVGGGKDIIYVNGKYYLLSESPAKVCVSEDLKNWIKYELNSDYLKPNEIAYGNGVFVICGAKSQSNSTYIYYSVDGSNWKPVKLNTTVDFALHCNSVKFINNRFVIATNGWQTTHRTNGQITGIDEVVAFFESANGSNWTLHKLIIPRGTNTNYKNASAMDFEYHNNLYVYVGNNGNIYTSNNLINWIKRESKTSHKLVGITYGKGQFVVTGDKGLILTSSNGINWEKQESGTDSYLIRSRYANGMYIACGYNGVILQSIDGISWKNISNKISGVAYGLAYNNIDNLIVITHHHYSNTNTIPIFYFNITRNITISEDDNSLFIFDKNLNMLGIIDSFISLRWHRKYFEAGEFEIVLPVTDYIKRMINTDVLVMRNNYTEAGIIETIEYNDNGTEEEIIISGRFLSCLLERRIVKNKINFSGQSIEGMNTIVDSMTPLSNAWETSPVSMTSRNIQFQCTYKNVYDYLCRLSEYSNIGFRIVPNVDSKVYLFETYTGKDRTSSQNANEQYSFSDDNFNIEQGSLVISNKTKTNYVLIGGQGEDSNRFLAEVKTSATGFDLHEIFVDQGSLSKDGLSDNTYRQQLIDIGESNITDGTLKFEVDATNIGDYKKKWDLGDIVNIKKEKWGIQTEDRIIEVEEVIEDGKKTIYPTFGSPLASAWKDD